MEKLERFPAPKWLFEKWEEWGRDWKQKLSQTSSPNFPWRQHKKQGYSELLTLLLKMTQNHCSFCDSFPLPGKIKPTIEHFRPKSKFPLLAYQWENLFACCDLCQEKGDRFDEQLLKPDEVDYEFERYFELNFETGELLPNPIASQMDQQRAEITILLYKLNELGRPAIRLLEWRLFRGNQEDLNFFSYRFFLKRMMEASGRNFLST